MERMHPLQSLLLRCSHSVLSRLQRQRQYRHHPSQRRWALRLTRRSTATTRTVLQLRRNNRKIRNLHPRVNPAHKTLVVRRAWTLNPSQLHLLSQHSQLPSISCRSSMAPLLLLLLPPPHPQPSSVVRNLHRALLCSHSICCRMTTRHRHGHPHRRPHPLPRQSLSLLLPPARPLRLPSVASCATLNSTAPFNCPSISKGASTRIGWLRRRVMHLLRTLLRLRLPQQPLPRMLRSHPRSASVSGFQTVLQLLPLLLPLRLLARAQMLRTRTAKAVLTPLIKLLWRR